MLNAFCSPHMIQTGDKLGDVRLSSAKIDPKNDKIQFPPFYNPQSTQKVNTRIDEMKAYRKMLLFFIKFSQLLLLGNVQFREFDCMPI